jgi:hypothetical protein
MVFYSDRHYCSRGDEMSDQNEALAHDYSTGTPRRHHELYIEDGNIVIQVRIGTFVWFEGYSALQPHYMA